MKDPVKLKELIIETVELHKVLQDYGTEFAYNPDYVDEVQFRCPIHGQDNKPSARLYKATKSCFCWVCRKRWDVVSFVMEKEGLPFLGAIRFIIDRYKIDTSSIPDDPVLEEETKELSSDKIMMTFLERNIQEMRGKIPLEKLISLVYAFYMISYSSSKGLDATESMNKLESKIGELCRS